MNISQPDSKLFELEVRLFGYSYAEFKQRSLYEPRVSCMCEVVERHYRESDWDLTRISHEAGTTENNLNQLMKRLVRQTGYQFLLSYRVYQSVQEALHINHTFTEIAFNNGFNSSSSYSRAVRRLLGCSPSKLLPRTVDFRRRLALPSLTERLHRHPSMAFENTAINSQAK
jgi:AraC-like DNA-binding protein